MTARAAAAASIRRLLSGEHRCEPPDPWAQEVPSMRWECPDCSLIWLLDTWHDAVDADGCTHVVRKWQPRIWVS